MNFGLRISNCEFHEPNARHEIRADEFRITNCELRISNCEIHEPYTQHEIRNPQFEIRNFLRYQQQLPRSSSSFQILVRLVRVL